MYFCFMLIDTHTHLYVSEFDADRSDMIKRAMDAGVEQFVLPAIDSETTAIMHSLKNDYPDSIHLMMGLHPTHVGENLAEALAHVQQQLATHSFVAVGEIGMDLYWDKSFQKEQQQAFAKQIAWALDYNLPIVIHCREAFDEIFEVLGRRSGQAPSWNFSLFYGGSLTSAPCYRLQYAIGHWRRGYV
jgi:TatD DNase family protein